MTLLEPSTLERKTLSRRSTLNPYSLLKPNKGRQQAQDDVESGVTRRAHSSDSRRAEETNGIVASDAGRRQSSDSPRPLPAKRRGNETPSRFNLLRFRNASEPQLGLKARDQAERDIPAVPRKSDAAADTMPAIITTAPTMDALDQGDKPTLRRSRSRFRPFSRQKQPVTEDAILESPPSKASGEKDWDAKERRKSRFGSLRPNKTNGLDDLRKLAGSRGSGDSPLANGHQTEGDSLAVPSTPRKSTSARSESGVDSSRITSITNDPTSFSPGRPHPLNTNKSLAWLPRKKQNRKSLFPLPVKFDPQNHTFASGSNPSTPPRPSLGGRSSYSPEHSPINPSPLQYSRSEVDSREELRPGTSALAAAAISIAAPGTAPLLRSKSTTSVQSVNSPPTMRLDFRSRARKRSSTWGSGLSEEALPTPPFAASGSGRNSMSTAGRSSFSNLFVLNRLRHSSDPHSPRQSSQSHGISLTSADCSQNNSLQLSREMPSLPDREEGETAMAYLSRVDEVMPKSYIPTALAKTDDDFMHNAMRSFMRKFAFFGDPLDMAVRKLLMEVDLPKETQQIDRVLQSFADRYHECNPGIFASSENAYFIAFSILILQTDVFNKNNKRKMTKADYIKNTSIDAIAEEVLDCYYDNIVYTPFIRVEDDDSAKAIKGRRKPRKGAKKAAKAVQSAVLAEPAKKAAMKEPIDPYLLIIDDKLDLLRPPIKEVMNLDDPYSYLGSATRLDKDALKMLKVGILQIESARSRPDAFLSPSGIENPADAKAGIVELPVDKVGVLWRKDPKKKTARSPWQEWGAVLCGAGLYFFKNPSWVKSLVLQHENHVRLGNTDTPCIFRPSIQHFKPDYMLPTDHGVALQDSNYKRHKNAFLFSRPNNPEEVFLADNDQELNDWLAKLNQQAAFKTAGVRQRGLLGGHYDGQRQRGLRRLASDNSTSSTQTIQTATGEVTIQRGKIDNDLAQQISLARQEQMRLKITEGENMLADIIKRIEAQLRDCRHLLILAPIQQKSRETLVHGAGRMSGKLKYFRIEMWRMKCHRDILAMDLVEEQKDAERRQGKLSPLDIPTRVSSSNLSTPKKTNGSERPSSANPLLLTSLRESQISNGARLDTKSTLNSVLSDEVDDVFRTPPESSPVIGMFEDGKIEPLRVKPHRLSLMSHRTPRSDFVDASEEPQSPTYSEYRTPILSDEEARHRRHGSLSAVLQVVVSEDKHDLNPPQTPSDMDAGDRTDKPLAAPGSPEMRKPRRPMQKTLRDSSASGSHRDVGSGHHRGRSLRSKGDSVSSANIGEDNSIDGKSSTVTSSPVVMADPTRNPGDIVREVTTELKREKGSFTVHGKKASVITFDADWSSVTPEERLKLRKEAQKSITITPSSELYTPTRSYIGSGSYLSSPILPSGRGLSTSGTNRSDADDFVLVDEEVDGGLSIVVPQSSSSSKARSSSFDASSPTKQRQSSVSSMNSATPTMRSPDKSGFGRDATPVKTSTRPSTSSGIVRVADVSDVLSSTKGYASDVHSHAVNGHAHGDTVTNGLGLEHVDSEDFASEDKGKL